MCLNAYLAHDPKLLEGAFAFLLHTPRLIDFANKVAYFRAKVTELKGRERMPPVSIAIHRSRAFEESFRQLKPKPASEMRGPLQVRHESITPLDSVSVPLQALRCPCCRTTNVLLYTERYVYRMDGCTDLAALCVVAHRLWSCVPSVPARTASERLASALCTRHANLHHLRPLRRIPLKQRR